MKKYITYPLFVIVVLSIFAYVVGSFTEASFNIATWRVHTRELIAAWYAGLTIVASGISFLIELLNAKTL